MEGEVLGTDVELLAPGAVDAGLFEADLSATALLAELEQVSAQLGDVLEAPSSVGQLDLGVWNGDAGTMLPGVDGMYNTTAADQQLIREAVKTRRKEAKAEKAAIKAERLEKREARLRAQRRAEMRASRQATDEVTANRGGPAVPGPASAPAAPAASAPAPAPSAAVQQQRPQRNQQQQQEAAAAAASAAAPAIDVLPEPAPVAKAAAAVAPVADSIGSGPAVSSLMPLAARTAAATPLALALPTPAVRPQNAERSARRAARSRGQGSARATATAAAAVGALPSGAASRRAASAASAVPVDLDPTSRSAISGYFAEASRNDLLSADQEKDLYILVQENIRIESAGRALAAELGRPPTEEEWAAAIGAGSIEAFRAGKQASTAAKQLMVKSNMRLVVSICKRYQNMGMSLSDLVSEGIAGLVRGVEKFDGSKGFKFSTYAHWWIRQGVTRALTDQGRLVRIPVHMQELLSRVQRTSKEMEGNLRRKPTRAELSTELGIDQGKLEEMYEYLQAVRSLEGPIGGDADGATLGDSIEDEAALDADESSLMAGLKDDMGKLLERLPQREAAVLRMRFGLDGEVHTLDDIGRMLKVTRERVRQIEAKALRTLRSNMGAMEGSIGEYSDASFDAARLAARTSSGTKKT